MAPILLSIWSQFRGCAYAAPLCIPEADSLGPWTSYDKAGGEPAGPPFGEEDSYLRQRAAARAPFISARQGEAYPFPLSLSRSPLPLPSTYQSLSHTH